MSKYRNGNRLLFEGNFRYTLQPTFTNSINSISFDFFM